MRYDPLQHHRRSTRLAGFDYAAPATYFVTVCVHGGVGALGTPIVGEERIQYRLCGRVAVTEWQGLPDRYPHIVLDEHVVMLDHFHALLRFAPLEEYPTPRATLGAVMGFWKHQTTRIINEAREDRWGHGPVQVWQRGFYDRIVRTESELESIRQYIQDNPRRACNL